MLLFALISLVSFATSSFASYETDESGGWQAAARNSSKSQDNGIDKSAKFRSTGVSGYGDVSGVLLKDSYGNIAKGSDAYGSLADYGHLGLESMIQGKIQQHSNAIPISEHVEVTRPVAVPIYKDIGIPIPKTVPIGVPHPIAVGVPQPYPVHTPYAVPIAIPVIKTIAVPVEKRVPYAVERIIPVPIEKPVPYQIEKYIPVPVERPYPINVPVYKHVFHRTKVHRKPHHYHWGH